MAAVTPEELVARSIAPIKREYLKPYKQTQGPSPYSAAVHDGEPAKSKRQKRKERTAQAKADLCTNYALGRCTFGDGCKFSHDAAAYLAAKPPDLPGRCPFSCVEACPYGITCRWACSHADHTGEQARQASAACTPSAEAGGTCTSSGAAGVVGATCELPLPSSIQRPSNVISKDLQQQLWKERYDFTRADKLLLSMGLRPGNGRAQQGRKQDQRQRQPPSQQQQQQGNRQQQQRQLASSQVVAVAEEQMVGPEAAGERDSKRQRMQGGAGSDAAAVATIAADSAAAVASAAGCSASAELDALYGGTVDRDDANGAAPTAHPGPAPPAAGAAAGTQGGPAPPAAGAAAGTQGGPAPEVVEQRGLHVEGRVLRREVQPLDLRGRTILAPLTTVGNLPFRRLCKGLGADVTIGEMALATNLLQGQASEWALLKRHPCEDVFGVQVCGGYPDAMARLAQLMDDTLEVDFVDINCGCPIDIICNRGAGSALMQKPRRLEEIVRATSSLLTVPLTVKLRKGYYDDADIAHTIIPNLKSWGAAAVTLHGRTRQQRYSRSADWDYIQRCAAASADLPVIGNGDVFSYQDWHTNVEEGRVDAAMVARGALIKPWIFTEIKEQRLWDISAGERFDMLRSFVSHGLEHWGSDMRGVDTTRRFLLEWLSFTHRYIPVALLEVAPQQMQWRPPAFIGRNDLETLLASESPADWVRISEMLLGPVPAGFSFAPKHKSNAYTVSIGDAQTAVGLGSASAGMASSGAGDEDVENG